ncbi:MAG: Rne/Rng family ribonuclease [Candidatus Marinimicrobia bacterium]|nr:Rne/Rng family ribonuclease [Candidatus Neomarinimicrobiota bacterium]
MKRNIYISETSLESRIAIMEEKQLVEFYIETPEDVSSVGNIYYATVENVQQGIHAAFLDIGIGQNGFLGFSEAQEIASYVNGRWKVKQFSGAKDFHKGQRILVQILKDAYANKGPRLTTDIAIPGRFVVLTPFHDIIGISKKIKNPRRRSKLKEIAKALKPERLGLIIRTVAEGKKESNIKQDIKQLLSSWGQIENTIKNNNDTPIEVYKSESMSSSVIRDLFTNDVESVIVDNKRKFRAIQNYVKDFDSELSERVFFHKDGSLFGTYRITAETDKLLRRKVWLKSGGHLIIDHTEAMFVIDVNSGRYIGNKEQEKNILKINLEAAVEIARQLRLRDISGLIVIDFIDMLISENRKNLVRTFKEELTKDRASVSVSDLSRYGLLEMTRERIRLSVMFSLSDECPMCHGYGRIPSKESMITKIDVWVRNFRQHTRERRVELHVHPLLFDFIRENKKVLRQTQFKHGIKIDFIKDESLSVGSLRFISKRNKENVTHLY